MTWTERDPRIVFTKHAVARIRLRTDMRVAEAKREIKDALMRGIEREGGGTFRAWSPKLDRAWIVARGRDGTWHVLTVLTSDQRVAA